MKINVEKIAGPDARVISGAPEGVDALCLAELAAAGHAVMFVARDDVHLARTADQVRIFQPDLEVIEFPAWDCLPYDRVSPRGEITSARVSALGRLAEAGKDSPLVLVTTVAAVLQRVPPKAFFEGRSLQLTPGTRQDPEQLMAFLVRNGYRRVDTVMEPGEFAQRGGIIDLYPSGEADPLRLDFFGDEVETIRRFDAATQRTTGKAAGLSLRAVAEFSLDDEAISRFRTGYRQAFGVGGDDDPLYESVSEGRIHGGMEHWLPLFHDDMARLTDYFDDGLVLMDAQAEAAAEARFEMIHDYFEARDTFGTAPGTKALGDEAAPPYRPLAPKRLYLTEDDWRDLAASTRTREFAAFDAPASDPGTVDLGGKPGRTFGDVRARPGGNVFDAAREHIEGLGRGAVVIAAYSNGSRDRLLALLAEHGLDIPAADSWADAVAAEGGRAAVVGEFERGFRLDGLTLITEQDILGERMIRRRKVKVQAENLISHAQDLQEGDLVVHVDHGIGRYVGLHTIEAGGAPHDCLLLLYAGDDKLFLPVENLELVSRFGSEEAGAQLDRLGGAAWQARKAKAKERIREMAGKLMEVAAARALKQSPPITAQTGAYDEFCAGFPFQETEDQAKAINDVLDDLGRGRPTDRLVCGDVGFGKTEVALRAAFTTAMEGRQVAVVVPTTLLSRQHFKTFQDRMQGFPLKVEQVSRLVTAGEVKKIKERMKAGDVDIVVGTHALLAKDVDFRDLGLLIIDEEQHFGVAHKERLKTMKADVHVLTLSATPIPRTLQLAMAGLRDMSLIATPPVDRLAVRTFVLPFDPVTIREALQREQYRGGQSYVVCPRIADMEPLQRQLADLVPDMKVAVAHGQMKPRDLEDVFSAFSEGAYDVLLSTNIIESGLDLPGVNTMIIHRADMFGLGQLYQLRGRVGRSKTRAYAYLTLPPRKKPTPAALKRLEVMRTLDSLGAGFTLASHDMDIRGAGNLLGEEQSGHVREVGVELYQQMLEEAVAEAKGLASGEGAGAAETDWSPQISAGTAVMIPDHYVPDLNLRLELYRRISRLRDRAETDSLAAEMVDRFGALPESVENLLDVVNLKNLCRQAGVEKIDAGPKGALVTFREGQITNPEPLVRWITAQKGTAKLRPDFKLVFSRQWQERKRRMEGMNYLLKELVTLKQAA